MFYRVKVTGVGKESFCVLLKEDEKYSGHLRAQLYAIERIMSSQTLAVAGQDKGMMACQHLLHALCDRGEPSTFLGNGPWGTAFANSGGMPI